MLRCSDDRRLLALALVALLRARIHVGAPEIDEPAAEALAVVDDDPSPELVRVLTFTAGYLALEHADSVAAVEMADRALLVASQLGLPVDVLALGARAMGRTIVGDRRGLDDYRRAIEEAQTQGLAVETCQLQFNLGIEEFYWVGPGAQILCMTRVLQLARRCGSELWAANAGEMICEARLSTGDWDELLTETARLAAEFQGCGYPPVLFYALQVLVSADRGTDDVLGDHQSWLEAWASEGPLDDRALCVAPLVALALRRCHLAQALDLLENGLPADATNANLKANLGTVLTRMARTAVTLGRPDLAAGLMARIDLATPFHQNLRCTVAAMVGEADGELNEAATGFADVAVRWHDFGIPYEEAQALLGQGRCLAALGTSARGGSAARRRPRALRAARGEDRRSRRPRACWPSCPADPAYSSTALELRRRSSTMMTAPITKTAAMTAIQAPSPLPPPVSVAATLRLHVEIGGDHPGLVDHVAKPGRRVHPAGPLGRVPALDVVVVHEHEVGRLVEDDLLHAIDDRLALGGVDGVRLLDEQLVVLGVRVGAVAPAC